MQFTHDRQDSVTVLRLNQVKDRTGLSRSTIYEMLKASSPRHDPSFPRALSLSARSRGFLSNEIDAWILGRASQRVSEVGNGN